MLVVQDDWIQYEATPVRRAAVRGGALCAQRIPVASTRRATPPVATVRPAAATASGGRVPVRPSPRLRLTLRGRVVLVLLPLLCAVSGGLVVTAASAAGAAPQHGHAPAVVLPE